jgi:hypothetical protein
MNQGNGTSRFTEVGGGSQHPKWEPQKDANQPQRLEAYFTDQKTIPGSNGRKPFEVYTLTTINPNTGEHNHYDLAGGTVLDDRFSKIPLNSFVFVEYRGKVVSKAGFSFHDWGTGFDANAVPYNKLAPAPVVNNNMNNQQQGNFNNAPVQNQGNFNSAPVKNQGNFNQVNNGNQNFNGQQGNGNFNQNQGNFNQGNQNFGGGNNPFANSQGGNTFKQDDNLPF